jgi:hypothetical protein
MTVIETDERKRRDMEAEGRERESLIFKDALSSEGYASFLLMNGL